MTLSQYRDELRVIVGVCASLNNEFREISSVTRELISEDTRHIRLSKLLKRLFQQQEAWACYRLDLIAWFWNSRIGNQPARPDCEA
jgi:hypothetical protein